MKRVDSPEWFYMKNGEKMGPVGFTELKELFAGGVVDGKSKIWAAGMERLVNFCGLL